MPNGTKRGRNAPTAPRDASLVALHRSRMFDWKPSAVVAIAPCPGAPLFAVGYESGTLELWDIQQLVCTHVSLAGLGAWLLTRTTHYTHVKPPFCTKEA